MRRHARESLEPAREDFSGFGGPAPAKRFGCVRPRPRQRQMPAVEDGKHGSERFAFCAFEEHFVEIVFRFEHRVYIAGVVGFFDDGESAFERAI